MSALFLRGGQGRRVQKVYGSKAVWFIRPTEFNCYGV